MNFPIEHNFPSIVLSAANIQQELCIERIKQAIGAGLRGCEGVTMRVRIREVLCSLHDDESGQDRIVCVLNAFRPVATLTMLAAEATRCFSAIGLNLVNFSS
jgi:hypothetical protein